MLYTYVKAVVLRARVTQDERERERGGGVEDQWTKRIVYY